MFKLANDDEQTEKDMTEIFGLSRNKAKEFVQGIMSGKEQAAMWRTMMETLQSLREIRVSPGREETEEKIMEWARTPLAQMQRQGIRTKILPRDLEKELRPRYKDISAPSEKKLEGIVSMAVEKTEDIQKETGRVSQREIDKEREEELSQAMEEMAARLSAFNEDFHSSYGRWIDQRGTVLEPDTLSDTAMVPDVALEKALEHLEASASLRKGIGEIQQRRKDLEATNKIQLRFK